MVFLFYGMAISGASMNQYLDYVTTNGYCQRVKTIVQFRR